MRYGTIIRYYPDKKYGFIRPDLGRDVFFHISALDENETETTIRPDQPVKYELASRSAAKATAGEASSAAGDGPRGPQAKQVMLIDKLPGGSIADLDSQQKSARHPRARKKKPTWRR